MSAHESLLAGTTLQAPQCPDAHNSTPPPQLPSAFRSGSSLQRRVAPSRHAGGVASTPQLSQPPSTVAGRSPALSMMAGRSPALSKAAEPSTDAAPAPPVAPEPASRG